MAGDRSPLHEGAERTRTSHPPPRMLGRYALCGEIARGGMATVHFGRLLGPIGFSRTVAIKRLQPRLASDQQFVRMFVDEALLAARVHHPNVVSTLDVVAQDGELALVMEYVQGESLARLMQTVRTRGARVPLRIVASIMLGVLSGLEAAHAAKNERGEPLGIVHRDMSPQNVIVGADGVTRVFDFGVARATGRAETSAVGVFKGKLAYAAPEQLTDARLDARTDLYAACVIFWEMLTCRRMFKAETEVQLFALVQQRRIERPSVFAPDLPSGVDKLVMRGLSASAADRPSSAREIAIAIEQMLPVATAREVAEWVHALAADTLRERAAMISAIETSTSAPALTATDHPSQTTAVPLTLLESRAPARRRNRAPLILAALGAFAALGVAAFFLFARAPAPAPANGSKTTTKLEIPLPAATTTTQTETTSTAPVADPTPIVGSATPSSAPKVPKTIYTAPLKNKPISSATGVVPSVIAPAATTTAAPSASIVTPPPPSCSPPFTVDDQGIKHLKPECL